MKLLGVTVTDSCPSSTTSICSLQLTRIGSGASTKGGRGSRGETGVTRMLLSASDKIGDLYEKEWPVDPVGVVMINPSIREEMGR